MYLVDLRWHPARAPPLGRIRHSGMCGWCWDNSNVLCRRSFFCRDRDSCRQRCSHNPLCFSIWQWHIFRYPNLGVDTRMDLSSIHKTESHSRYTSWDRRYTGSASDEGSSAFEGSKSIIIQDATGPGPATSLSSFCKKNPLSPLSAFQRYTTELCPNFYQGHLIFELFHRNKDKHE